VYIAACAVVSFGALVLMPDRSHVDLTAEAEAEAAGFDRPAADMPLSREPVEETARDRTRARI
jgi:hypothetical protein